MDSSEVPAEIQKKQFPAPSSLEQEHMSPKNRSYRGVRHDVHVEKTINCLDRSEKYMYCNSGAASTCCAMDVEHTAQIFTQFLQIFHPIFLLRHGAAIYSATEKTRED